jgi:dienelactone hydrolase
MATVAAVSAGARAATDPFTAYLDHVPAVLESLSSEAEGAGTAAITTKTFTFASRDGTNTVFAIHSAPQAAGKYPGLLVLHGGGGNAQSVAGIAKSFAARGYVTLAVDLPQICLPNCSAKTTGPWSARPGEAPRFEVQPGPEHSVLLDAELAGVDGFNWLRSQPNVDAGNMGIFGFSWGGYSTTFLTGLLGDKVKAAYAVFGCGFYEKGSFWKDRVAGLATADRDVWLTYFDAGRRAPAIKGAYFLEGETNDTFFWPDAVQATIDAVPGNKNHVWGPNLNHVQVSGGPTMLGLHMDYYLKGLGAPFSTTSVSAIEAEADGTKRVTIDVKVPAGVTLSKVQLYYSEAAATWQTRNWSAIDAAVNGEGRFVASFEPALAAKQLSFYGYATDSRNVTTATSMYDSSSIIAPNGGADGSGGTGGIAGSNGGIGGFSTGGQSEAGTSASAGGQAGSSFGGAANGSGGSSISGAMASSGGSTTAPGVSGCSCRLPASYERSAVAWLVALGYLVRRRRTPAKARS